MSEVIETGEVTPVANPEVTPENVAAPVDETPAQLEEKKEADDKRFTQEELNEIVKKEKARAEARAERRVLKTLEKLVPQPTPRQEVQPAESDRPKREAFDNDEDWVEAVADWKLTKRDQAVQQQRMQAEVRTLAEKTETFYAEASKVDGFDREEFDALPLTPTIANALIESDAAAKLMVWMVQNPDDVERISGLSPVKQIKELDRIEAKLASAPKPSKAPPPITPVGSRGSASNNDLSKSSMEEYLEARKKQGAGWSRW